MPKKVLQVTNFSGGLNCYSDARDIKDEEFAQNWNAVVDKEGIVRVSGMASDNIATDSHDNTNFEAGFGLFQFSTDYSNSEIKGDFNTGIKSGILTASGSTTTAAVLESTAPAQASDYYKYMHLFIHNGIGVGESADITGSSTAAPPVLSFSAIGADLDGTSEYIIYPWYYQGYGEGGTLGADGVTNGHHTSMESAIPSTNDGNYYFFSKKSSITDNESADLGYLGYNWNNSSSNLELKSGGTYHLSFKCAGAQKFTNAVCDGTVTGSSTTHGDRVPGIQIQNTQITDKSKCIRTCDSHSPGLSNSATDWTNGTYYNVTPSSITSDKGTGGAFNIVVASGVPKFYFSDGRGVNYEIDDELVFTDPGGGSSSDTATIIVANINRHRYRLYADGTIGSNQEASFDTKGAKTSVNFVNNGDFAAGVTDSWTESDSGGLLALSELASDGYDGDDGTCKMESSGLTFTNGFPDSYIYQDLTLHNNVPHHLNFQYDSSDGIMYSIYDSTTGVAKYIQGWTILPPTRGINDSAKYRFAGSEYNSKYSGATIDYTMKYINFKVENSPLGTDITDANNTGTNTIRIAFAPVSPDSIVNLTGVTVHIGTHDLVTMSYKQDGANNPFEDVFKSWSTYSMTFTIPENWKDDSNYILDFYFGEFGFRDGNSLGGTGEQLIYVDDMKLVSEDGDIITLLSDNKPDKSSIHAHSSKSGTWSNNYIKWSGGTNSKPVYNYVDGMLKISDGNFNTNNQNKLLYFSDRIKLGGNNIEGWRSVDNAIPLPPSVVVQEPQEEENYTGTFIGADYLNLFFHDTHFGRSPTAGEGLGPSQTGTNWNLDEYGTENIWYGSGNRPVYHGLVMRNFNDDDLEPFAGGLGSLYDGFQELYNRDTQWYQDNIAYNHSIDTEGAGTSIVNTSNLSQSDYLYTNGWATDGTPIKYSVDDSDDNIRPHNPIQMIIKGNDSKTYFINGQTIENKGMNQVMSDSAGDVREIYLEVKYKTQCRTPVMDSGWQTSQWDNGTADLPQFQIRAGIVDDSLTDSEILDNACMGIVMNFKDGVYQQEVIGENGDQESLSAVVFGDLTAEDYDPAGRVTYMNAFNPTFGGNTIHLNGWPVMFDVHFNCIVSFPKGQVKRGDTLLIQLSEIFLPGWEYQYKSRLDNELTNNTDLNSSNATFDKATLFSRFLIEKVNVNFYNAYYSDATSYPILINSDKSTQVDFVFDVPQDVSSTGWGERMFKIATTSVNVFDEESSLGEGSILIGEDLTTGLSDITVGHAPSIKVSIGETQLNDSHISKTKFYMKDTTSDIWYLQFYVTHHNNRLYSTTSGVFSRGLYDSSSGLTNWHLSREHLSDFNEVNSYEVEAGVSQQDALSNSTLTCRYKASVVANNRLYVGNIYQNGRKYGDRIIKSPIGKYNLLPASNFLDVTINDGDEITALDYYKDKLLLFKKRKVFIINTSGDYEFIEDTFENIGVNQQCSVTKTPHGVAWVNKYGCFLYDGEEKKNLIEGVIPSDSEYATIEHNYWISSVTTGDEIPTIGYDEIRDSLVIKFRSADVTALTIPDGVHYHFLTKSWTFLQRVFSALTTEVDTGEASNMITSSDGEILYYRHKSGGNGTNSIKKWINSPLDTGNQKPFQFTTKDFTFGDISVRKKIYKVYVTYKTNSNSTILVKTSINGGTSYAVSFSATASKFAGTQVLCYNGTTGLLDTGNIWKVAELRFTTSSDFNNIYSFQLNFTSATVPKDFEINDISIVYRAKNVK